MTRRINAAGLALIKEFEGLYEAPARISDAPDAGLSIRRRRRFLNRPSIKDALVKGASRNPVVFRYQRRRAAVRHLADETPIVRLNGGVCPSAIARLISSVHILAFDRQVFAVAVGESPIAERLKAAPLLADTDTATSVVRIAAVASGLDQLPDVVEPRPGRSVPTIFRAGYLRSQAPARFRFPLAEIGTHHHRRSSAIAAAKPKRSATGRIPRLPQHHPAFEALSGKVDEASVFSHSKAYNEIVGEAICYG